MSVSQKDAVFNAIAAVKKVAKFSTQVQLTSSERRTICASLLADFSAKNISYSGDILDTAKLQSYINSLVSNWLRKDTRLNGGVRYRPQKSVRVDPNVYHDDTEEAMRILRESLTDEPSEQYEE